MIKRAYDSDVVNEIDSGTGISNETPAIRNYEMKRMKLNYTPSVRWWLLYWLDNWVNTGKREGDISISLLI